MPSALRTTETGPSDLERAGRGETDAVGRVVERAGPWVHALVTGRTDGRAHDLVASVFQRLWREAEQFDPARESELVFVARIARRELAEHAATGVVPEAPSNASDSAHEERGRAASEMPCDESRRLLPFVSRLRPEQMRLLKSALHGGRKPLASTHHDDRAGQRDELRALLIAARASLGAHSDEGEVTA